MTPLISLIIPVYNSENYIYDTIVSCLKQTYKHIEIIVVDDGSEDNSGEIIKKIDDQRIKYYKIPNSGACHARNFGIKKATGELFQFLDADDLLDEEKLENQIKHYHLNGTDFIYSGVMGIIIKNEKRLEDGFNFYYKNLEVEAYFRLMFLNFGKYFTTGIWLVPRKLIEQTHGWDEKALLNDDGEYFARIILQSKGVIFCPDSIFYYRRDVPMSLSKKFNSKNVYDCWLYSYSSYVKHFFLAFDKKTAAELGRKALSVYYCNSYPHYPDLLLECRRQIRQLGYRSPVAHGGNTFKLISLFLGVDNALKIRSFKDKNN